MALNLQLPQLKEFQLLQMEINYKILRTNALIRHSLEIIQIEIRWKNILGLFQLKLVIKIII